MYLIEWMYDRKNAANHSVIVKDWEKASDGEKVYYIEPNPIGKYWKYINLKKIAWLRIKPAPKPYRPPVGQTEGGE